LTLRPFAEPYLVAKSGVVAQGALSAQRVGELRLGVHGRLFERRIGQHGDHDAERGHAERGNETTKLTGADLPTLLRETTRSTSHSGRRFPGGAVA
jgi:hypothetical protein